MPSERSQRRRHGLDAVEIAAMLAGQGHKCLICRRDLPASAAVVDHDHALAALHPHPIDRGCRKCVRGLLCNGCNTGLGGFRDDPEALRRAAAYVEAAR